ncbi:octaprenyl-diphosphate synthase [Rubritalea squalenifaciens DSM 18772]|uniref:Octaprenyl-diphosphate synthase n=1 Tax=Rubritalea squalenifaciens DSM 18772 TaxID=1123071 RepID=A0A1M6EN23_9BACT|nr:polyprenyl synthetase family protein [Rubritalea squalenifaciens]SHI86833.1 octaprenyl-diphosphate synthase [Rubritalea squalenifaciens DSM 18772]
MALLKPFSDSQGRIPFELVRKEINKVEAQIRDQVRAFDPNVEPYIDYICNTSGKRIRPALAILAGGAVGEISDDNLKIGVILELIHMATLVHDDIIDGATTRRKVPTANAKWGNGMAVLLGDALFSHSLLLATEFGSIDICRKVGKASREVCEGEVMQTQRRFDLTLTKEDYFHIIAMKTGALFAAAAGISASISGADEEVEQKLYDYGLKLGTAYQIYDDCLDLVGAEDNVGKTLRTDLEKGKLTLPMLNLLESASEEKRSKLNKRIIEQQPLDLEVLVGIADYEGAIEQALDTASTMLVDARTNLDCLEDSKYRKGLIEITHYLDGLLNKCRK